MLLFRLRSFSFESYGDHRDLHSFPTRRSSDLPPKVDECIRKDVCGTTAFLGYHSVVPQTSLDRKSTRLNSSHVKISYAVFCLKKKKASMWSTATRQRNRLFATVTIRLSSPALR